MRLPSEIFTGCPELDLVWRLYTHSIIDRPGVAIPDTEEDLNWHAFLGHSIDMQGFRAAEFAGVDPLTRSAPKLPKFVPLRQRDLRTTWYETLRDTCTCRTRTSLQLSIGHSGKAESV